MEARSGACSRRQGVLRYFCGALFSVSLIGFCAPAYASNVPPVSAQPSINYEQALSAYERGDFITALENAKIAGERGDVRAQVLAAHILSKGEAGRAEKTLAKSGYERAALSGDTDAMVALGEMGFRYEAGLEPKDAVTWWTQAAQAGRHDSMRALADLYLKGVGVRPNTQDAIDWLTLAADQGDALSAKRLGDNYLESAPKTAIVYYKKAAEAGNAEAAYAAAIMYAENLEIRPNEIEAERLMSQAAWSGHAAAMADYGLLIFQGLAEQQESKAAQAKLAAQWFEKAAKAGDDQGRFFYAYSLAKGEGVPQDVEEAYYWILQTRKSGISQYDKDIEGLRTALEAKLTSSQMLNVQSRITP